MIFLGRSIFEPEFAMPGVKESLTTMAGLPFSTSMRKGALADDRRIGVLCDAPDAFGTPTTAQVSELIPAV